MTWLLSEIWASLLAALAVGALFGWLLKSWRFGPLRQVLADLRASLARQDTELTKLKRERDDVQMRIKRQDGELSSVRAQAHEAAKLALDLEQWQQLARELEDKVRAQPSAAAPWVPSAPAFTSSPKASGPQVSGPQVSGQATQQIAALNGDLVRLKSELAQSQKQQQELQKRYEQALAAAGVLEKHKAELAKILQEQEERLRAVHRQLAEPAGEEQRLLAQVAERDARFQAAEARNVALAVELSDMRMMQTQVRAQLTQSEQRYVELEQRYSARLPLPQALADDLKRIRGIGAKLEQQLHALGVTELRAIAAWSEADTERISAQLGSFRKRVRADDWVGQAKTLLGL